MVLDGVVRAARQQLGNLGPSVADALVRVQDLRILLRRPGILPDVWVQVVVPSNFTTSLPFPALLAGSRLLTQTLAQLCSH